MEKNCPHSSGLVSRFLFLEGGAKRGPRPGWAGSLAKLSDLPLLLSSVIEPEVMVEPKCLKDLQEASASCSEDPVESDYQRSSPCSCRKI